MKTVTVVISAVIFTLFGMGASLIMVLNRPNNFHDPEGLITMMMVGGPMVGGLVSGVIVGMIAASMCSHGGGPSGKQF